MTVAGALACPAVHAQEDGYSTAEGLFKDAVRQIEAGRFAQACPELERAQALVKGIGVMLYLGECYEQTGRLVAAWRQFRQAEQLASARGDRRATIARERARELWPRLSKLVVLVAGGADAPPPRITDDEAVVEDAELGAERPVEPGAHHIRATASGRTPWVTLVEIAPGATARVEVPPLLVEPVAAAATSLPAVPVTRAGPAETGAAAPEPGDHPTKLGAQRTVGIAVLGVGLGSLVVGTVFGVQAQSKLADTNSSGHCQPNDHCDSAGLAERSDALTDATISTLSFVGGAACVGAGAAIYLLAPRDNGVSLVAWPRAEGGATLDLRGAW
jgi:hypothetical protein